jgi:ribosomal protein S8
MRLTDPVADMLTRVRNALHARHQKVDIPASRLKLEIARILKEEGFISNMAPTMRLPSRRPSGYRGRGAASMCAAQRFPACLEAWGSTS